MKTTIILAFLLVSTLSHAAKFECEVPYTETKVNLKKFKSTLISKSEESTIMLKVRARDVDQARTKAIDKCVKEAVILTVSAGDNIATRTFKGCDLPKNIRTQDKGEITCREI